MRNYCRLLLAAFTGNYCRFLIAAFVVGLSVGLFAPPFAAFLWMVLFLAATFIKETYPPKLFGKMFGGDDPVFHVTIMLWAGAALGLLYQLAH